MITLKQFLELISYKITESTEFQWECYGNNARSIDSWDGNQNGHSLSIIFDTMDQTVYEVQAHDYKNNRAYRVINPDFVNALAEETLDRGCNIDEAWDNVDYVNLDLDEDFLEKAWAIIAGKDYDTRVTIPLNLPEESINQLMRFAHEADITLNQYVERILTSFIKDGLPNV